MEFDFEYWCARYLKNYSAPIEYFVGKEQKLEKSPLFKGISKVINRRGYLKPVEFINICTWKTRRQKKRYKNEDNLRAIRSISSKIIKLHSKKAEDCIAECMSLLINLDGVQVPVASALLTVLFPKTHCVIDYRVRRAIYFIDNSKKYNIVFNQYGSFSGCIDLLTAPPSIEVYLNYLKNISEKAKKLKCTPRELEMALWEFDANKGEKD